MPANRALALLITTATGLAACGGAGSGSGPTAASADAQPSCTAAASVSLQPGQTQPLSAQEAACFRLAAGDGAEYALAGYDARALEASRAGQQAGSLSAPQYTIADASGAARSVNAGPAALAAPARPADVRYTASAALDAADPFARTTAWREGERFQVKPLEGSAPVQARVVRVVGQFALAVVESDEPGAAKVLEQATEALQFLAQRGVPLLQSTFSASVPRTSEGSGQLLVLATAWDPARGAAATWTREDAGHAYSFVWLNLNLRPGKGEGFAMYDHASYRVKVLGHELTHAWQAEWLHEAHAAGGHPASQAPAWSMEGGADFVAMDLVRRFLGVGLAANWKWSDNLEPSKASVVFALEPFDARGRLTWGYYDASSLLRDLQGRLMAAGMTAEAAMAEVSRGAVEGWHGTDGDGGGCAGLVERMRGRLGAAWDPAGAVLLWTASQAADDRTPNAALSNPTYYDVATADDRYGWKPAAEVRAGSGQSAAVTQVAGGSFYVRVKGARAESTLSAVSSTPDARWMIVRVR